MSTTRMNRPCCAIGTCRCRLMNDVRGHDRRQLTAVFSVETRYNINLTTVVICELCNDVEHTARTSAEPRGASGYCTAQQLPGSFPSPNSFLRLMRPIASSCKARKRLHCVSAVERDLNKFRATGITQWEEVTCAAVGQRRCYSGGSARGRRTSA